MLLAAGRLSAQRDTARRRFPFDQAEITYQSGMIMPHVPAIDFISNDYTWGLNVRLLQTTRGTARWHHLYSRPVLGIGYHQGSLGNDRVYGGARSLYGFFEGPVFRIEGTASLVYRMSAGVSYLNKTYEVHENNYNIAIGSHLNLHYRLSLLATVRLTDHYQLVAGAGMNHFSNGKIQSPNKGLNLLNGSLGLRYAFYHPTWQKLPPGKPPQVNQRNHFSLIWSHGIKDHSRFQPGLYYVTSLNCNYERQYARVAKYGIGLDAFYNPSLINHQDQPGPQNLSNPRLYRMGLHLSHDLIVGDFSLTMQLGHYLYNKVYYITDFYNRIGLKYYHHQKLIFKLALKSHNANAEFIEFGVGYQW